jgi:transcriptional regulator with XRE-family HTH domain
MSYQDELDELDEEIRQELRRHRITTTHQSFSNPAEMLSFLRTLPVRKAVKTLPFSSCLRRLRTHFGVSFEDLAEALTTSVQSLEELESNDSILWAQPPYVAAAVASAFRLHVDAINDLTRNSYTIALVSGRISDSDLASKLMSSWLAEVRQSLETLGETDLIA